MPSPLLSLHDSSIGTPEKGTLKGRQKIPAAHRTALPPAWHNSYLLYFCVYNDFYRQNRTAWTCVAGDGQVDMERHLCIGTSMWQLAYSLVRPAHGSAVLARALWHRSCHWHDTIHFSAFLIPNAAVFYLLSGARRALTQQGTQLLLLIQFQIT